MRTTRLSLGLILLLSAHSSFAAIVTGPGGRGVPVGGSSIIGTLDYSDTFTGFEDGGSNSARIYEPAIQAVAAYAVENTYGNPAVNFRSQSQAPDIGEFSFAADKPGTPGLVNGTPNYPGSSGAGSATGFTQTGGGGVDFGISYGLRDRYLVQFDAVNVNDRIDITSGSIPGTIFQANSLSIFIRGNGTGNASLYNGTLDTPIRNEIPTFNTGLANDGQWHNFAVLFDRTNKTIEIFVDEQSSGVIDLTTFAGGLYQNFSNAAVGVGAGLAPPQDRIWTDNFQVGAPVPEPSSILMLSAVGAGWLLRRRRS
jgi:hypothetical protein